MKVLIDSNVLVAALLESHEHHSFSRELLERAFRCEYEPSISNHGLAETYSQLTAHPRQRISPQTAITTMTYATDQMTVIELQTANYKEALGRADRLNVTGGGVYDLLHVEAASKAGADLIATWNVNHFKRLCANESFEPLTPEEILGRR